MESTMAENDEDLLVKTSGDGIRSRNDRSSAERDPRKRKRLSSNEHSVEASMERGGSSSPQPPKARSQKRYEDNWAQRAEAFIHKVNDAKELHTNPIMNNSAMTIPPGGMPYPYNYGTTVAYQYPQSTAYPNLNMPAQQPNQKQGYSSSTSNRSSRSDHHERRRDSPHSENNHRKDSKCGSSKRDDSSSSSSSSSDSEDDKKTKKGGGITSEQREKLKVQKDQYERAQEKLETQLLKLKEQREALKEGGAKHEDKIMKDNARLQKEVKNRIIHMREVLEKIAVGLEQPIVESSSPRQRKSRREMSRRSKSRNKSTSTERSDEKSKKKKKKKVRDKSSSDDEDEDDERDKKKRRKKKKDKYKSSSSSDDSESESDMKKTKKKDKNIIHMDESVFRMVADLKASSKSSKKGDDMFMDLLGKMSEAYMKAKQENNELTHRINALESENQVLKKQIEDLKKNPETPENSSNLPPPPKWDMKTSHVIQVMEPKKKKKEELAELEQALLKAKKEISPSRNSEENTRSIRAQMIEKEKQMPKPNHEEENAPKEATISKTVRRERRGDRSSSRERRRRSRSRDRYRRDRYYYDDRRSTRYRRSRSKDRRSHSKDRRSRSKDRRSRSKDRRSRSKDRRSRSKDRRSRSKDRRSRSKDRRSRSRDRRSRDKDDKRSSESKKIKDKNDKIDLDEWAEKPSSATDSQDKSLLNNLKEKIKQKEEQQKQQWAAVKESTYEEEQQIPGNDLKSVAADDSSSNPQPPLPPRPQVAIQWGKGIKKGTTPEPAPTAKKSQPIVGKMPWLQKGNPKKTESRFGPPGVNTNIPPPGVITGVVSTPYGMQPVMEEATPTPPPLPPPPKKNPPKNPTPQAMNMEAMLAAAQAHISARSEELVETEMEIPLPPLPEEETKSNAVIEDQPVIEASQNDTNSVMFERPPEEDMDPTELAMLGIDPSDFAGFGK